MQLLTKRASFNFGVFCSNLQTMQKHAFVFIVTYSCFTIIALLFGVFGRLC